MTDNTERIEIIVEGANGIIDRNMGGRPYGSKMTIDCINLKECVRQLAELANGQQKEPMKENDEKKECCGSEDKCSDATKATPGEQAGTGVGDGSEKPTETPAETPKSE